MSMALSPLDAAADAERLHAAMEKWRRRSHMIRFFRWALPAAMGLITLAVLAWVAMQALRQAPSEQGADVSVRMIKPVFRGRDENGRAYALAASEAARDARNFQRVLLKDPALTLDTGADTPMRVRASRGVYNERTLEMVLEGKVRMDDPSGWVFETERARVDTKDGVVSGDLPVQGVGPKGRIAGSSYVIYNQGDRIILRGQVRSTLTP